MGLMSAKLGHIMVQEKRVFLYPYSLYNGRYFAHRKNINFLTFSIYFSKRQVYGKNCYKKKKI